MTKPLRKAAQLVRDSIPKFNPVIANGVATAHFKELEDYIHQILVNSSKYFPRGLEYHGYRRALPEEECRFILEKKASSKSSHWTVEIAHTTTYLMIYQFTYEGNPIDHELYLPYLVKGAQMWVRGTPYTIVPVLTAPVFSVESLKQQIFVKLLMNKLTFNRQNHTIVVDGEDVTVSVVWAMIHRVKPKEQAHYDIKKDESVKMKHATVIYLFSKYGLMESFRRYTSVDVDNKAILISNGAIDWEGYGVNRDDYVLYQSKKRKPLSVTLKQYTPHDIEIAILKEHANDTMVLGMIAGFFYIADNYSIYMVDPSEFDDPSFWRILLGKMCLRTNDSVSKLLFESNRHMDNVDRMLDELQRADLHRADIRVDGMIDLLAYIVGNFSQILRDEEPGSLYGKRLLILRNILEDIIKGINMISFRGNSNKIINDKTIKQEISKFLVSDKILAVHNAACSQVISSPSDNIMFSHTCRFLLQNNISKNRKGSKINLNDPDKHLHPSVLEIGSYQVIKESEPTGRQLLNPYQVTSLSGITKQNPELKDKIAYMSYYLNRN